MEKGTRLARGISSPLRHQPTDTTSYVEKKNELIVCSNCIMSSGLKSRPKNTGAIHSTPESQGKDYSYRPRPYSCPPFNRQRYGLYGVVNCVILQLGELGRNGIPGRNCSAHCLIANAASAVPWSKVTCPGVIHIGDVAEWGCLLSCEWSVALIPKSSAVPLFPTMPVLLTLLTPMR